MTLPRTLTLTLSAILLSVCGIASAELKPQPDTLRLKIAAQPLGPALNSFAQQSGLQVVFFSEVSGGLISPSLEGTYTAEQALGQLLANTALDFRFINARTVAIRAKNSQTSGAAAELPTPLQTSEDVMQLAQIEKQENQSASTAADARGMTSGASNGDDRRTDEVVVTGSHIRGNRPAGSRVIVIDRDRIDRSGYGRIEDLLGSVPQVFKGASEEYLGQLTGNTNRGAEIQLRGLGPGTTLTLVNGHRQPAGGTSGAFTDITSIPVAAIERIEILTDGASAIYGSDAIGGVVNVILRKDFQGAESTLRLATADGERDELNLSQVFGAAWKGGNALVGYQYSRNDDVPTSARRYSAANSDMRQFGGNDFRETLNRVQGNPGTILCPAGRSDCVSGRPAYAIPSGQDGKSLAVGDLIRGGVNYTDGVTSIQVLPEQELHAAFLSASQSLSDRWDMMMEGRYGTRAMDIASAPSVRTVQVPSSNPFYRNPFGGSAPVSVAYDFSKDIGPLTSSATTDTYTASLGLTGRLAGQWKLKVDGSYGRERANVFNRNIINATALTAALQNTNPATALNVFGDGSNTNPATLQALRQSSGLRGISANWYGSSLVDGPLLTLPGGWMRLAVGADYRDETYRTMRIMDGAITKDVTSERNVSAAFAEIAIPIVGAENARAGLHRLDMALAARFEDYDDFGSTLNPKAGLVYMPSSSFKLRGTWGTSFRAPPFYQADEQVSAIAASSQIVADPKSPTSSSKVLRVFGNNEDLKEETATVWTTGLDVTVAALDDLMFSATYFDIDYKDKIQSGNPTLLLEDQWAPLITRDPSRAQIDGICGTPAFTGDCTGTIAAILDFRYRNVAAVQTRGIDFDLGHLLQTSHGDWSYGMGGVYTFEYSRKLTDTAPSFDIVDTVENPLALRMRGRIAWSLRGWNVGAFVNYVDDYRVSTTDLSKVGSWTSLDFNLGFRAHPGSGWLDGMQFAVNAVNVFNKLPPFVNRVEGYDSANASILGRLLSVRVTKSW